MYESYQELDALPAEAFLSWENFLTRFDVEGDAYAQKQYASGLEIGRQSKLCGPRLMGERGQGSVYIRVDSTWAADIPPSTPGGTMAGLASSYEGIGFHRGTAYLLRGFLDSGARIVVIRRHPGVVDSTVIQELKEET